MFDTVLTQAEGPTMKPLEVTRITAKRLVLQNLHLFAIPNIRTARQLRDIPNS